MNYFAIPLWRLSLSLGFIVVAVALSRGWALRLERELSLGALRAAVQLVAIGYALKFLFAAEHPLLVGLVLLVMAIVAGATAAQRVDHGPPPRRLFVHSMAAVLSGALAALVPMFTLIVVPAKLLDARYVIPIGGMMLSSSMNVVAQTFERLFAAAHAESSSIEARLALGASPAQALAPHVKAALRSALIPTINGLVTVGLVALPGMMTGQIVAGTPPEEAVRYQLVIMYQLVAVAAVSGVVAARLARNLILTPRGQLRGR